MKFNKIITALAFSLALGSCDFLDTVLLQKCRRSIHVVDHRVQSSHTPRSIW